MHGWYFTEHSTHLQGVSESYTEYATDDNHGCYWNDPVLGMNWPFDDVILSERAAKFGGLSELLSKIEEISSGNDLH